MSSIDASLRHGSVGFRGGRLWECIASWTAVSLIAEHSGVCRREGAGDGRRAVAPIGVAAGLAGLCAGERGRAEWQGAGCGGVGVHMAVASCVHVPDAHCVRASWMRTRSRRARGHRLSRDLGRRVLPDASVRRGGQGHMATSADGGGGEGTGGALGGAGGGGGRAAERTCASLSQHLAGQTPGRGTARRIGGWGNCEP